MWTDVFRQSGVRFLRGVRRSPGLTVAVVLTMALGIGANATMYGILDRLLLQPPRHVVDQRRVRRVVLEQPGSTGGTFDRSSTLAYPDYLDLTAHPGRQAVAAYRGPVSKTAGSGETATRVRVVLAGWNLFPLLGVHPVLGRFFAPEDTPVDAAPTVVLSQEYWARTFGSDPHVLGRMLKIAGRDHTIIGIAPAGFTGVELAPVDVWVPLEPFQYAEAGNSRSCLDSRSCWWLRVVVRLAPGVTVESAEGEATRLYLNGRREYLEAERQPERVRLRLTPLIAADGPNPSGETRVARWLSGVSLIVLLIACANVANLLMARGIRRRREVAVRLALGVDRRTLIGQMVLDSVLLALVGGGVAVFLAQWGGDFVRSTLLPDVLFPGGPVSGRVVAFTLVVSIVAGLVAGVAPALQSARTDLVQGLKSGARGAAAASRRLRSLLTVAQAAMSAVLLVGAGLFVRSLDAVRSRDLGLDTDRLVLATFEFNDAGLSRADKVAFYRDAVRRVEALPSVESASYTAVPFQWGLGTTLTVPGWQSLPRLPGGGPYYYPVAPGYFETTGLKILRGRALDASDSEDADRVAVASATMARTLWPGTDGLGGCLMFGSEARECTTVVGVAEDAARSGFDDPPFMAYYLPLVQVADADPEGLYLRSTGRDVEATAAAAAPLLRSLSTRVRYVSVRSFADILDPQARTWTLGATLFTAFGLLALCVAMIGLHSLLAFDVAQRTCELGIRSALGADRARLLRGVLARGGRLAAVGITVGLAVAFFAAPHVADLLFDTSPRDPWVMGAVALALGVVATAAGLIPGLRATRADPMAALRAE